MVVRIAGVPRVPGATNSPIPNFHNYSPGRARLGNASMSYRHCLKHFCVLLVSLLHTSDPSQLQQQQEEAERMTEAEQQAEIAKRDQWEQVQAIAPMK